MDKDNFNWSDRKRLPHPEESPVPKVPAVVFDQKNQPVNSNDPAPEYVRTSSGTLRESGFEVFGDPILSEAPTTVGADKKDDSRSEQKK